MVYGTIIGISGNRRPSYNEDLMQQVTDINRLAKENCAICMIGDYNCTFSDNYYFTQYGRDTMKQCFSENKMTILTAERLECIDHIAITDSFTDGCEVHIEEWNSDKRLSDHKGIAVNIG